MEITCCNLEAVFCINFICSSPFERAPPLVLAEEDAIVLFLRGCANKSQIIFMVGVSQRPVHTNQCFIGSPHTHGYEQMYESSGSAKKQYKKRFPTIDNSKINVILKKTTRVKILNSTQC